MKEQIEVVTALLHQLSIERLPYQDAKDLVILNRSYSLSKPLSEPQEERALLILLADLQSKAATEAALEMQWPALKQKQSRAWAKAKNSLKPLSLHLNSTLNLCIQAHSMLPQPPQYTSGLTWFAQIVFEAKSRQINNIAYEHLPKTMQTKAIVEAERKRLSDLKCYMNPANPDPELGEPALYLLYEVVLAYAKRVRGQEIGNNIGQRPWDTWCRRWWATEPNAYLRTYAAFIAALDTGHFITWRMKGDEAVRTTGRGRHEVKLFDCAV